MKKISRILVSILAFTYVLSTSSYALGRNSTYDSRSESIPTEEWIVMYRADGSIYLENSITGEQIVESFKFDHYGNRVEIDLVERAAELNERIYQRDLELENNISLYNIPDEPLRGPSTVVYLYEESYHYRVVGDPIKITADINGPASITYGESVTIGAEYGGSVTITSTIEDIISSGAEFSWSNSAESSSEFTVEYEVPAGKKGYVTFTPYYNKTVGVLNKKIVSSNGYIKDAGEFDAWGQCPIILATGFADGEYDITLK